MESNEQREPQGTPEDREEGTPQENLVEEGVAREEDDESSQGDVGAPQEGGADFPADAEREGG